ncbi:MAG: diguanylate cyclase [Acidobacteria bacterium]|nr:diguanylate cyclase [Acidobacteriota bacterium]
MSLEAARILIIDDDDLTLTILRKMLEADGYEVDVCSSGSEALAKLLHCSYDAILCDMWMSGMNGKDFYLQLKQGFPEYQRRVVFITGDIASEATWEFIDERHLPYVIKPISRPLLRRKVVEIVGDRPMRQPVEGGGQHTWDGVNRRHHRRVAISATARVRRKKWEVAGPDTANVVNASRGGIFFVSDREYRVGMEVFVAYPFTGYDDVEQDGYVVRVEEQSHGKRGVAIAIGEEALSARDAFAGSEEDVRRHHIMTPAELAASPLTGPVARLGHEDEETHRREEELVELKLTHDKVIDQRDRLAAEEANLRKKLEELEAAKASMSQVVNGLQSQMETLSQEREQFEEVRHKATHDALTGLWNRGAILDVLKRELVRAQRESTFVGVLLGDLDHFKNVNDTHGHLAGDAVLRESAQRIGGAVRSYDAVGRYGGEEFLIILSSCEDDIDMVKQAERIRSQVCAGPVQTTEAEISITLSLGVASSSEYQEVEDILRAADAAMYRAKRAGRNRVEVACAAEPQKA